MAPKAKRRTTKYTLFLDLTHAALKPDGWPLAGNEGAISDCQLGISFGREGKKAPPIASTATSAVVAGFAAVPGIVLVEDCELREGGSSRSF